MCQKQAPNEQKHTCPLMIFGLKCLLWTRLLERWMLWSSCGIIRTCLFLHTWYYTWFAHEFTIELSWWYIEGGLSPVHVVLNHVSSSQSFMIIRDKLRPWRKTEVPTTQEQPKLRVSVLTLCRLFRLWVSLSTIWIHILFLGNLLEEYKYYPEVDFSPTYIWLSYNILTTTKTKRILDFYIYIYMPFNTTHKRKECFRKKNSFAFWVCLFLANLPGAPWEWVRFLV